MDQGGTGELLAMHQLIVVVQSRICRVDVRYPSHISSEAKDFMTQVYAAHSTS